MPFSFQIYLEAQQAGVINQFTGRGVHGFWFQRWQKVDPSTGDSLHNSNTVQPFTLSPLMGLPGMQGGVIQIRKGWRAQFRLTLLDEALGVVIISKWLPGLPGQVLSLPPSIDGDARLNWKVTHVEETARISYEELSRKYLISSVPPRQWTLDFLTPTTFHGKETHLPFPLPKSLAQTWLRRWNLFAPMALPEEVTEWAHTKLAVSSIHLQTLPAREADRLRVGCVGRITLRAIDTPPYLRAALDVLAHYAEFCGSGSHTTQGLGQTKFIKCS